MPEIQNLPNHIAIIPDGNRRWAKQHGLPTIEGHRRGAQRFKQLAKYARQKGIHTLTAWGFSTENWTRDAQEVSNLMDLFIWLIRENEKEAHEDHVRIHHLGRKDRIPAKLLKELEKVESETSKYDRFDFNICIDYGGQDEIIRAVNKVLTKYQNSYQQNTSSGLSNNHSDQRITLDVSNNAGNISEIISTEEFYKYLDTDSQEYPNPDLLIRTSGEMRTSGLMPFQTVYTELYFEEACLPDFTTEKLEVALQDYANRNRRFGGNTK